MSFMTRPRELFFEDSAFASALGAWRDAEDRVRAGWHEYLTADRPSRRREAFAAYLAALDAEAAAAHDLAAVVPLDRAA